MLPERVLQHAPVHVLDVGANPLDDEVPYVDLLDAGLARVTGFEPLPEAMERLRGLAGPHERYLPHAVGDGGRHVLHVCEEQGFSSLLRPDPMRLAHLVDFERLGRVVDEVEIDTVRLDDVPDLGPVDLLKVDVQGSELAVLRSGEHALERVLAVQLEMGFWPLYEGQPTAGGLDAQLRSMGLMPLQVVQHRTWPLAPTQWADPWEHDSRQVVESDVLYVRDPAGLAVRDLAVLALVADIGYRHRGLARRCLRLLDECGRGDLEAQYVSRLGRHYG